MNPDPWVGATRTTTFPAEKWARVGAAPVITVPGGTATETSAVLAGSARLITSVAGGVASTVEAARPGTLALGAVRILGTIVTGSSQVRAGQVVTGAVTLVSGTAQESSAVVAGVVVIGAVAIVARQAREVSRVMSGDFTNLHSAIGADGEIINVDLVGWWDGTSEHQAEVLGWWDGTTIQSFGS